MTAEVERKELQNDRISVQISETSSEIIAVADNYEVTTEKKKEVVLYQ